MYEKANVFYNPKVGFYSRKAMNKAVAKATGMDLQSACKFIGACRVSHGQVGDLVLYQAWPDSRIGVFWKLIWKRI